MKQTLTKAYPPYSGDEPFIYLCFDPADSEAVEPLLSRLWARGCRIWYSVENSETAAQERKLQERMLQAGLCIAFCTGSFLQSSAKGRAMVLQSKSIPLIAVDREPTDNLSTGFREGTVHISATRGITRDTEAELIATEGFSQEYIGQVRKAPAPRFLRVMFRLFLLLTAAALAFFLMVYTGVIQPKEKAPDPQELTVLTLDRLPEELSELETYPKLEKIILPQSEAERAAELLDRYTIVLRGEE